MDLWSIRTFWYKINKFLLINCRGNMHRKLVVDISIPMLDGRIIHHFVPGLTWNYESFKIIYEIEDGNVEATTFAPK